MIEGEVPLPQSPLVEKSGEGKRYAEGLSASCIPRKDRRNTNHRDETRQRMAEERVTVRFRGEDHDATVLNLSSGGAMLETELLPEVNEVLWLRFADCDPLELHVRWVANGRLGLEFCDETEVIAQILEDSQDYDDRRFGRERRTNTFRHDVYWQGKLCVNDRTMQGCYDAPTLPLRLRNISATGAMLRVVDERTWLQVGAELDLDLGIAGCLGCQIRWRLGLEIGVKFDARFDIRRLSKEDGRIAHENPWARPDFLPTENRLTGTHEDTRRKI